MAGLVQKFKQMWTPPEDEYDYDFEEMDMDDEEVMDEISSSSYEEEEAYQEPQRESRRSSAPQSGNKVVNIHAAAQLHQHGCGLLVLQHSRRPVHLLDRNLSVIGERI